MAAGQRKPKGQWTGDERKATNLNQRRKSLIMSTLPDSPGDKEDTRSSHENLNDLEEKYQAIALLAKSKRFFKKGLIAEAYKWDKEEVSLDDNEMVEVKVLMALAEKMDAISKEGARNAPTKGNKSSSTLKVNSALAGKLKSVKIEDDPPLAIVMKELNDLKLQISKNQSSYSINNQQQVPQNVLYSKCKTQFKRSCDLIISIRRGIKPRNPQYVKKSYETYGSTIHTTTDHNDIEWVRRDSSTQEDSKLKKPIASHSMKALMLPNSQNLQLKTLTLLEMKDIHMMNIFILMSLLKGAGMLTRAMAKELSAASSHECLFIDFLFEKELKKEAFTRALTQYKEYLCEFWYNAKNLDDSKIWASTHTGGIRGDTDITTFRNTLRAHYLSHSSMYVLLPFIIVVRLWFAKIRYNGEIGEKELSKRVFFLLVLPPIFGKIAQLGPGLLSLTFDGFGFDLWAKLVPELWNFDKLSFNVRLFDEKLRPDPAFLCGF
nr:hypothetical protein [Tanacetum cinerariifolium]